MRPLFLLLAPEPHPLTLIFYLSLRCRSSRSSPPLQVLAPTPLRSRPSRLLRPSRPPRLQLTWAMRRHPCLRVRRARLQPAAPLGPWPSFRRHARPSHARPLCPRRARPRLTQRPRPSPRHPLRPRHARPRQLSQLRLRHAQPRQLSQLPVRHARPRLLHQRPHHARPLQLSQLHP
jgi:hypothetical protein